MLKKLRHKLSIQLFASEGNLGEPNGSPEPSEPNEEGKGTQTPSTSPEEPKMYSDEDVKKLIEDAIKSHNEERTKIEEQNRAKEQGEYQKLYEELLETQRQEKLSSLKTSLIKDSGFSQAVNDKLMSLVQGDDEEALTNSFNTFKELLGLGQTSVPKDLVNPPISGSQPPVVPLVDGVKEGRDAAKDLFKRMKLRF